MRAQHILFCLIILFVEHGHQLMCFDNRENFHVPKPKVKVKTCLKSVKECRKVEFEYPSSIGSAILLECVPKSNASSCDVKKLLEIAFLTPHKGRWAVHYCSSCTEDLCNSSSHLAIAIILYSVEMFVLSTL